VAAWTLLILHSYPELLRLVGILATCMVQYAFVPAKLMPAANSTHRWFVSDIVILCWKGTLNSD